MSDTAAPSPLSFPIWMSEMKKVGAGMMTSTDIASLHTYTNSAAAAAAAAPTSSSSSGGGGGGEAVDSEEAFVADIQRRIAALGSDQGELNIKLSFLLRSLEEISERINRSDVSLQAAHYVQKIRGVKVAMGAIGERLLRLRTRVNNVRDAIRPLNQAYVEEGAFRYRCCYAGGVMYRAFPSGAAKKTVLVCDAEVAICERIHITGENSVFLHHSGVGYLIENRGSLVCMQRLGLGLDH